ncbi:MAG: hypothetical protein R3F50_02655 [Gammaproteobacteria bacterium]|jgi:hypothetical protein
MNYSTFAVLIVASLFSSTGSAAENPDCVTAFESPGLAIRVNDRSPELERVLTEILTSVVLSSGFERTSQGTFEAIPGSEFPYTICSARFETSVNNLYWKKFF